MVPPQDVAEAARVGRRLAAIALFGLGIFVTGSAVRGIVTTLFSGAAAPAARPSDEETRETCARELAVLEADVRRTLAEAFGAATTEPEPWPALSAPLEARRAEIVARCDLDASSVAPEAIPLVEAASALEEALGAAGLLWERHRADGAVRLREARERLQTAADER